MKTLSRAATTLIIVLSLLFANNTYASHIMGSDITWTCLGNDSFVIQFTVYRDCNGVQLSSMSLNINCKSTGNLIKTILIPKPIGIDITPVSFGNDNCSSGSYQLPSRCTSLSNPFPYGIEKYVYQSIVDLSSAGNCCEIIISFNTCCRNSSISTGLANAWFHVNATLNRCLSPCDNSPTFTNPPISIICYNQNFVFNHGVIDQDNGEGLVDSLAYEWDYPLGNNGANLNYSGQYNFDKPIYFWGFPNKNLPFPRGFHLDSKTGDISFRPMKIEQTVMAIKVSEYRNGVKIGEIRRDMQVIVINCPANNPPSLSGPYYKEICATNTVTFTINTYDPDPNDTLKISWNQGIPGGQWSDNNCMTDHPTGIMTWTPGEEFASPIPYNFTVTVVDGASPVRGSYTRSYQVLVKPLPKANISIIDSGCGNYFLNAQPLLGDNPQYLWIGDFQPGFAFTGSSMNYHFKRPGTYPFSLTVKSRGCERVYFDTIEVDTFLYLVLQDYDICEGESINLTANYFNNAGPVSVKWSTGINDTLETISFQSSKDTFVSITCIDSNSCIAKDTSFINIHKNPIIDLNDKTFLCNKSFDILNPSIILDESIIKNIRWIKNPDNEILSDTNFLFVFEEGSYLCEVEDSLGCVGTDSTQVIFNPEIIAHADDKEICFGDSVLLTAEPTGSKSSNVNYKWFLNDSLIGSGIQIKVFQTLTTNFKMVVSEELNGILCNDSTIVKLTVNPNPIVNISQIDEKCISGNHSESINLNSYLQMTPSNSIVSWNSTSSGLVNSSLFSPILSGQGVHKIFVNVTNSTTTCFTNDSISIKVNPLPYVFAGEDKEACSDDLKIELTGNPYNQKSKWFSSESGAIEKDSGIYYFNPQVLKTLNEKQFDLIYSYTDNHGCQNLDTMGIKVYKTPEPFAGTYPDICEYANTIALTGQPAGGVWSGNGVENNQFNPQIAKAGKHTLSYQLSNGICIANDQTIINVNPIPILEVSTFDKRTIFCKNESLVELIGIPSGGVWSGDGIIVNYFDPTFGTNETTEFDLIYSYQDSNGCSNEKTLKLKTKQVPEIYIDQQKNVLCYPDIFSATATYKNADGIEWYLKVPLASGTYTGNTGLDSINYQADENDLNRQYFVLFSKTKQNDQICQPVYDSVKVKISDLPNPEFEADSLSGCKPLYVKFKDLSTINNGEIKDWKWIINESVIDLKNPNYLFEIPGEYSIKLQITSNDGCRNNLTKEKYIHVYDIPEAGFITDPEIALLSSPSINFQNTSTHITTSTKYLWNFGDHLSFDGGFSNLKNPSYIYSDTGAYSIKLITENEFGCSDYFEKTIYVKPDILVFIPSAFKPKGLGPKENQIFKVSAESIKEFNLQIFDRWGNLQYGSTDYETHGWDGTYLYSNKEVSSGVYVYVLKVSNETGNQFKYSGTITLIR